MENGERRIQTYKQQCRSSAPLTFFTTELLVTLYLLWLKTPQLYAGKNNI